MKGNNIKPIRVNRFITAPFVRVTMDGENLGVMSNAQAQEIAYQENLDLIELVASASPPVCSIMDYGKWKFDQKKKEKDQKQKTLQSKEVRLRPVSSDHDVLHKVEKIKDFLKEKRNVIVNVRFKKREISFKENGKKILEQIIQLLDNIGVPQGSPKFEGNNLSVRFNPK